MGTYSSGYHDLMARLDAERPVPTVEEAWQAVRWWLDWRQNGGSNFVDLEELERHLRVLLAGDVP